jgi:hypothetical protein
MKTRLRTLAAQCTCIAALSFTTMGHLLADTTISTTYTDWTGYWGPGEFAVSYGQSFTVPVTDTVLQSFQFEYLQTQNSLSSDFKAYLFSFNPGTLTASGTAIWTSSLQTVPSDGTIITPVFTLNQPLNAGETYLFLISSAGLPQANPSALNRIGGSNSSYPGGGYYYQPNTNDPASFTGNSWSPAGSFPQTYFTTTFATPVPEPSTWTLAACGILATLALRHRRKAAVAATQ